VLVQYLVAGWREPSRAELDDSLRELEKPSEQKTWFRTRAAAGFTEVTYNKTQSHTLRMDMALKHKTMVIGMG
jgi:hypothetical protein